MNPTRMMAVVPVQALEGIERRTLVFNPDVMICHFSQRAGARIPIHDHVAVQAGYVVRGKMRFFLGDGTSFEAIAGDAYLFESWERHGSEALEDSELVESFTPSRPEYETPPPFGQES
ncbi:MAG: cupin domain-containing protein [Verrucomicrobia bacterium]|nr:cupin domain-containing protein [Verrucomicrobiota bacterium]